MIHNLHRQKREREGEYSVAQTNKPIVRHNLKLIVTSLVRIVSLSANRLACE